MTAMSRRFRAFAALAAVASLLFMQLALAAFACPGTQAPAPAAQAMPGGCEMDMASPLCHSHCAQPAQSLDKPPAPSVPAVAAIGFVAWPAPSPASLFVVAPPVRARATPAPEPPPLLRNCVLRI